MGVAVGEVVLGVGWAEGDEVEAIERVEVRRVERVRGIARRRRASIVKELR